ncbi:MAG TPA: hypothetical protein VHS31_14200 [Tepidisphaeraceae bacterium]|jgi:Ca2+-binding RTX toxin-like protein|nr:hypothetical protein [Tepidisphaeraceae bacterium]
MEFLESRRLLSANPLFQVTSKGTLIIHGTPGADEIRVFTVHNTRARGIDAVVGPAGSEANLQDQLIQFRARFHTVKRLWIDAGGGDDRIDIDAISDVPRPATVLGGAGDDAIAPSKLGPLLAIGGAGNDNLFTQQAFVSVFGVKNRAILDDKFHSFHSAFSDTLLGGAGNDTLYGDLTDHLDGGSGNDQADLMVVSEVAIPDDRVSALAHDYYQRLGTISIEQTTGRLQIDGPVFVE